MLEEVGPDLHTASAPLRFLGAEVGTRMTVVRLSDGDLVLISPCAIDDALAAEIDALGRVRAIVAPNAFHHLYYGAACERYPDASAYYARGVEKKLASIPRDAAPLDADTPALFSDELEHLYVPGIPQVNEVVFFHRRSRTLILTDLLFHFEEGPGGWTSFFLWLDGALGNLAFSRVFGLATRDRPALRGALSRILDWDFDRLVVAHGANIPAGAKERVRAATAAV